MSDGRAFGSYDTVAPSSRAAARIARTWLPPGSSTAAMLPVWTWPYAASPGTDATCHSRSKT